MSVIKITESRVRKFLILNEEENLLKEANDLLSAIAFARGALEENLEENPFESSSQFLDSVIISLSLSSAVNLMNIIREISIMTLSDYTAILNAYKNGHLIRKNS